MTDQLISLETAAVAREKGFDWPTNSVHARLEEPSYLLPTQSLLQKWLREQHRIKVLIDYFCIGSDDYEWGYVLKYEVGNAKRQCERLKIVESVEFYPGGYTNSVWPDNSYEAALEKGLLEALKLI